MVTLLFALLAGILTVAAPCTLPVLPVLFGASIGQTSKARPVFMALGFVASFTIVANDRRDRFQRDNSDSWN